MNPDQNSSPHVYVATNPGVFGGNPSIPAATYGYNVAASGQLTPISGFPLPYALGGVISGNHLFVAESDQVHLDTYLIGPDGSLTKAQSIVDPAAAQCQCEIAPLMADRSGSNLYVWYWVPDNNAFLQTFSISPSTGALTYQSTTTNTVMGPAWGFALQTFSANDLFAYGASCAYGPCVIGSFSRSPGGPLSGSPFDGVDQGPSPPPGVIYSVTLAQADEYNHLAAVVYSYGDNSLDLLNVPDLLASFTVNPDGSLTTTNTMANMPASALQQVLTASLSPSGRFYAVAGEGGVQIFNFNGAAPMTAATGVLAADTIASIQWDNQNHLYALSTSQQLYVYTITSAGVVPAPGSPYSIPNAAFVSIQP